MLQSHLRRQSPLLAPESALLLKRVVNRTRITYMMTPKTIIITPANVSTKRSVKRPRTTIIATAESETRLCLTVGTFIWRAWVSLDGAYLALVRARVGRNERQTDISGPT